MGMLFGIFFIGFFIFVVCGFIATSVFGVALFGFVAKKGLDEWESNNRQPVLSVEARVVGKRQEASGHVHHHGHVGGSVSTWHHVTFELSSGERREFTVGGEEYGMLVEDDAGTLTYQGTRYKGFERQRMPVVVSVQD